jgi:hypothetical protein
MKDMKVKDIMYIERNKLHDYAAGQMYARARVYRFAAKIFSHAD